MTDAMRTPSGRPYRGTVDAPPRTLEQALHAINPVLAYETPWYGVPLAVSLRSDDEC